MVLVVETVTRSLLDEMQHVRDCCKNFAARQYVLIIGRKIELVRRETEEFSELGNFATELAVQLVTTHTAEVITTVLKKRTVEV